MNKTVHRDKDGKIVDL